VESLWDIGGGRGVKGSKKEAKKRGRKERKHRRRNKKEWRGLENTDSVEEWKRDE